MTKPTETKEQHSVGVSKAMRELRREIGLTQVQLASALGITPTTVYRYEAASGEPSNDILAKALQLAVNKQAALSIQAFVEILSRRTGMSVFTGQHLGAVRPIEEAIGLLTIQDRLLVMAMVLMLREATDETAKRMASALLGPWLQKAKEEFRPALSE